MAVKLWPWDPRRRQAAVRRGRVPVRAVGLSHDHLVVAELALVAEEGGEPRGVVERDDEHVKAGVGGEAR